MTNKLSGKLTRQTNCRRSLSLATGHVSAKGEPCLCPSSTWRIAEKTEEGATRTPLIWILPSRTQKKKRKSREWATQPPPLVRPSSNPTAATMRSQLQSPNAPTHLWCRALAATRASSASSPAASSPAELHTQRAAGCRTRGPTIRRRRRRCTPSMLDAAPPSPAVPHRRKLRRIFPITCSSASAQDPLGFGVSAVGTKSYRRC